jgi:hypothetical protein
MLTTIVVSLLVSILGMYLSGLISRSGWYAELSAFVGIL